MMKVSFKALVDGQIVPVSFVVPDEIGRGLDGLEDEEKLLLVLFRIWKRSGEASSDAAEIRAELNGGYYDIGADEAWMRYDELVKESVNLWSLFQDIVRGGNYMYDISGFLRDVLEETPFK